MLGNGENDAALEVTLPGLSITVSDECCAVLAGADLGMTIDGKAAQAWTVYHLRGGERVSLVSSRGDGCRSYLCFSGGINVPVVMGSRSTYTRARLGGYKGRALKAGDVMETSEPKPLWRRSAGLVCPLELRRASSWDEPLDAMDGPQAEAFSDRGLAAFYGEEYIVTNEADRMGYRLDGPEIERVSPADIVSDGIVFGSVQAPGNGRPIVMMADHQTAGGYTKIAVLDAWSAARLAQKLPGVRVRFRRVKDREAAERLKKFENDLWKIDALRASHRSR
jgi:biotin-dependent carboxylase-like uncharacterized protein